MRVGERTAETQGLMSRALDALIQHYNMIHGIDEFIAVVVRGNEALKWYVRNGFKVLSEDDQGVHIGRWGSTWSVST
jgi:RimJ/RimL family protein N-acetyltransferase